MTSLNSKIVQLKKYITQIDKEWYQRYHNFITHIKDKKGFNPVQVVQNPNLNIIQLLKDPDLLPLLDVFVSNPRMNSQIVESMGNINWNLCLLSADSHISILFIISKIKTHKFNWHTISSNKYISMADVEYYEMIPWNYRGISLNPSLKIFYVKKFYQEGRDLDWVAISKHKNIKMCDIGDNPNLPWVMDGICLNPNITSAFIKRNAHWKWNYMLLSENPGIRLRFVFKNLDKPWSWTSLSGHPRLTLGIISKFCDKPWNWYRISANPAFTLKIKKKHPEFPWTFKGLSCNPSINMMYVIKHIDKNWDFDSLSFNRFTQERNRFYEMKLRQYFMASKIVRFWKKQSNNLDCAIGRKLSSIRYDKLQDEHEQMYIDEEEAQKALASKTSTISNTTMRRGVNSRVYAQNVYS